MPQLLDIFHQKIPMARWDWSHKAAQKREYPEMYSECSDRGIPYKFSKFMFYTHPFIFRAPQNFSNSEVFNQSLIWTGTYTYHSSFNRLCYIVD